MVKFYLFLISKLEADLNILRYGKIFIFFKDTLKANGNVYVIVIFSKSISVYLWACVYCFKGQENAWDDTH